MPLGDKYATLNELKSRMQVTVSTDDTRYTDALNTASRAIEGLCGRQFNDAGSTSARIYYPDSYCLVRVDDFSTSVGFVLQVNGATWSSNQYQLEPLNGIYNGVIGWPYFRIRAVSGNSFTPIASNAANISVTAKWGWAAVPAPIHEATLVGAEELAKLRDAPFGIGGYGDFGVIKVRDNPFVKRLCADYMVNRVLMA